MSVLISLMQYTLVPDIILAGYIGQAGNLGVALSEL